uniref:Phosphoprotein n=1 Tax=Macrotermes bellicosus lispivirus 1 TaxID=3133480 RepID=A0AAT9JG74_9MONO
MEYSDKKKNPSVKDISDPNSKIEQLDLEDILKLTEPSSKEFGFYHLNAERNLALSKLGFDYQTSGIPKDHTEFFRRVDQLRTPEPRNTQNLSLLSRGKLINLDILNKRSALGKKPITKSITNSTYLHLENSKNNIFTELVEEIDMATSDKEKLPEVELSASSEEEDQEERLLGEGQSESHTRILEAEEAQNLTPSLVETIATRSPSNIDISHLYTSPPLPLLETPSSQSNEKTTKHVTIKKIPIEATKRPIPKLVVGETPVKASTSKENNDDESALRDITLTGFGSLASMISDLHEGQSKLLLLMGTLVGKVDSIETRMSEMELSISILKGAIGTMDADVKNLLQKQPSQIISTPHIASSFPEQMLKPSASEKPAQSEEDQKEIDKAKAHYKEYLSGLKMKHLDEQTFVQAHLMGGLKSYFAKVYPGKNGVEYQLELVQVGDARGEHFMAIDRALMRLRSSLHKPVYLPVDPTVPIYPGISAQSTVEAPPQATGLGSTSIDPKSLYTHIRSIYK